MTHRDVVDQLLDQHALAHAGSAEQPDLTAADIRTEQVDDLDAGLQDLRAWIQLDKRWRIPVDGQCRRIIERAFAIYRLAQHIEHPAQHLLADGHMDHAAVAGGLRPALHALARAQRDAAHPFAVGMGKHFRTQPAPTRLHRHHAEQRRQFAFRKAHVDDRSDDPDHCSDHFTHRPSLLSLPVL